MDIRDRVVKEDDQSSPKAGSDHPGGVRAGGAGGPRISTRADDPSSPKAGSDHPGGVRAGGAGGPRIAALLTGGSRGLGRALAEELAARGARVVLVARGEALLRDVVEAIRARGGLAWGIAADVGEPGSEVAIAGQAAALAGSVDVLVNNASTLGEVPLPLLADADPDDVRRTFEVNVLGPFRLTRAVLGPMLLRGRGLVVNVSSDAAVEPYPGWGAYGASKAALDHMTRILAAELAGSGVRAVAVDPGEMDTAMHAAAIPDADPATLARPADVARRLADLIASAGAPPAEARIAV